MRKRPMLLQLALVCCLPGVAPGAEPPMSAPPRVPLVEDVSGLKVSDPFRPLEDLARAQPWIDAQNARTDAWMAAHARPEVEKRLAELFRVGSVGSPSFAGPYVFFLRKGPDDQQSALYVREGEGEPRPLLDPNRIDAGGRVAIDWYHPSRDGALVAYGTSNEGDEVSTLRVIEVATGRHLPDEIPFTRACSLTWLPDRSGFIYTRNPGREAYDRQVFLHRLGTDPAGDPPVMGKERLPERTDWPGVTLDDTGRWLVVVRFVSWSNSTLHVLDRQANRWIDIAPPQEGLFGGGEVVDGQLWVTSTHGAPLGRIVRIDPAKPAQSDWIEVLPEAEGPLEGFTLVPGGLVTTHLIDAASRLGHYGRDGKRRGEIALPVSGSVRAVAGKHDDPRLIVGFDSFFYPPTLLATRVADVIAPLAPIAAARSDVDTSAYVVEQVSYPSFDGTRVPMFLVHRKGLVKDGSHPTLLYGYGGFNVSLTPGFARNVLFWLEKGGVYAVANLRGGGEKGEAWHQAGMLGRKHQVFGDFEYAMRHLLREGYTRPDKLALLGGSNGGLLVGAAITRVPHLFRAGVAKVGLYDMLRYHRFPPAELWIEEYGSAENAEQAAYLFAYSPYHQVLDGVAYPAVLAHTAEKDTRVHWAHTAKFVARLQEATASPHPILLRFERAAGHGAGKATSAVAREYAEMYLFLLAELGLTEGNDG